MKKQLIKKLTRFMIRSISPDMPYVSTATSAEVTCDDTCTLTFFSNPQAQYVSLTNMKSNLHFRYIIKEMHCHHCHQKNISTAKKQFACMQSM